MASGTGTGTGTSVLSRTQNFPSAVGSFLEKQAVKEMLAEFIGTFILVALGDGAVAAYILKGQSSPVDTFAICFCFGIGALIGISAAAPISGGHINPAVTLAMAFLRKFSWKKVWHYLVGQYLGGMAAAAVVYLMYHEGINQLDGGVRSAYGNTSSTGSIFATYPSEFVTITGALIDQILGTACLMIAVLAVTDEKGMNTPKWLQPTVLGLVIVGLCVAFGLNCAAILNPARDLGPRIFTAIVGYGWEPFQPLGGHYWWVAGIVGPHVGAIIGGWVYNLTIDHQSLHLNRVSSVDASADSIGPSVKGDYGLHSISLDSKEGTQTKENNQTQNQVVLQRMSVETPGI